MARDRKRAKQRQQRRVQRGAPGSSPEQPPHADVPGALEHVGDVDEFDAALVRGAGGVPVADDIIEEKPVRPAGEGTERTVGQSDGGGADQSGSSTAVQPSGAPQRSGNRPVAFLRASWAELQRVQWPDRPQVTQATAVVLGFVILAGAYLGAADWVAQKIVNFIL